MPGNPGVASYVVCVVIVVVIFWTKPGIVCEVLYNVFVSVVVQVIPWVVP